MQFGQLLRRRLTIANTAAQNDPALNDSVKGVLSVIAECLTQQAASMELIQAELSDKIGSGEFKQITGQKLSLRQFLGYFQKVERIVQKMQSHWANTQTRTQQLLQSKLQTAMQQINLTMNIRTDQIKKEFYKQLSFIQAKSKDIEQFISMLTVLKDQIQNINANCSNRWEDTKRKLSDRLAQTKQELIRNCSSSQKLSAVVGEIKQMQTYFNQTHQELASLIKSLAQTQTTRNSTVAPQIINHITALENVIGGLQKGLPGRWFWQCRAGTGAINWQQMGGGSWIEPKYIGAQTTGILIERAGLHRLVIGYVLQSQLQGELRVSVQDEQILRLELQGERQRGLCRSAMLFVYLGGGSHLYISIASSSNVTGFLQLQHL